MFNFTEKNTGGFKFTSCALAATWAPRRRRNSEKEEPCGHSRSRERKAKRSIMKGKSVLQEQSGQLNVAFDWAPSTSRKDKSFPQIGFSTFREAKNHKTNGTNTAADHQSDSDSNWKRWKPIKIEADLDLRVAVRRTMWTCDSACVCAHHARCCAISIELEATTNIHSDKRPWADSEKKNYVLARSIWRSLLDEKIVIAKNAAWECERLWVSTSEWLRPERISAHMKLRIEMTKKWVSKLCDGQIFAKNNLH